MSEWKETTLGEICLKITDGAHHSPKEFDGGKPMFSVKNMRDQGFDYNGVKTISDEDFVKLVNSGCQPQKDDILIAKDGSVMKHIFRVKGDIDYVLLSSIAIVRPDKSKVNPSYLVYAIKDPSTTDLILNNFVGGSGVPRIVLKDFKKVDLTIPSIETQKSIASILSSLDDKIDLLHRQNATLEKMAETLFRQWFIEDAKEEWEIAKMESLISIGSGKGLKKESFIENGLYPILGANGEIGRTNEFIFDEKLIYTGRVGTLGNIFRIENEKVWLSDNTLVIKPLGFFNFIYFTLKNSHLEDYDVGSTQPLIRQSDIKEIEVVLPPIEILKEFESIANKVFQKIKSNQTQIRTLTALRDTLLPKLMSGEIRVL